MSKPYSGDDFTEQITGDRTWRLKEISDLKSAVERADTNLQRVLLRSLIAICYAHWEGYVRFAARKYLEHIALHRLQYCDLNRQFLRNYFLPRLTALSISRASIVEQCSLIDEVLEARGRRFSKVNTSLIDTKSNLNFDVFSDICLICGVPTDFFRDQNTFIDVVLLKRRNAIAHGEDACIGIEDMNPVAQNTISLMRAFGDHLENLVHQKGYRKN